MGIYRMYRFAILLFILFLSTTYAQIEGFYPKGYKYYYIVNPNFEFKVLNLHSSPIRDSISIERDEPFLEKFAVGDSSGKFVYVRSFYFIIIDSLDIFSYELYYNNPLTGKPIPFDSIFHFNGDVFYLYLYVKKGNKIIDSAIQYISILNVDPIQSEKNAFLKSNKATMAVDVHPAHLLQVTLNIRIPSPVRLSLHSIRGELMQAYCMQFMNPGVHACLLRVDHFSCGMYILKLYTNDYATEKKVSIIQ
jgi:hypothetical protein